MFSAKTTAMIYNGEKIHTDWNTVKILGTLKSSEPIWVGENACVGGIKMGLEICLQGNWKGKENVF